jgi:hypothetical protein
MRVSEFIRPVTLLHAEAFCLLCASCIAYQHIYPHHWGMFAYLFLVPDFSLFLFMRGPNTTASVIYNVVHSYVLPVGLGALALLHPNMHVGMVCLIWIGHISFDRMLGYGLKYPHHFKATHLQRVGDNDIANVNPRLGGTIE